jgi:hypothetical protein
VRPRLAKPNKCKRVEACLLAYVARQVPLFLEFSYIDTQFPRFDKAVRFYQGHPKGKIFPPRSPSPDIVMTISEFQPKENIDLRTAVSKVQNKSSTL